MPTKQYTFSCPETHREVVVSADGLNPALKRAKQTYEARYRTPAPKTLIGRAEGMPARLFNFH